MRQLNELNKLSDEKRNAMTFSTLSEMIIDRGFSFDENKEDLVKKMLEFNAEKETLNFKANDKNLTLTIPDEDVPKKEIKLLIRSEFSKLAEKDSLILIICNKEFYQDESLFYHMDDRVCIFSLDSLLFNVTKHRWVPNHMRVNVRERTYIMKKYNLKSPLSLPLINVRDPIFKYYGWRRGDICRITRYPKSYPRSAPNSQTKIGSGTGAYISYRYITDTI